MLLTLEQEAKRQRVQMPSPERIKKVCSVFEFYLYCSVSLLIKWNKLKKIILGQYHGTVMMQYLPWYATVWGH